MLIWLENRVAEGSAIAARATGTAHATAAAAGGCELLGDDARRSCLQALGRGLRRGAARRRLRRHRRDRGGHGPRLPRLRPGGAPRRPAAPRGGGPRGGTPGGGGAHGSSTCATRPAAASCRRPRCARPDTWPGPCCRSAGLDEAEATLTGIERMPAAADLPGWRHVPRVRCEIALVPGRPGGGLRRAGAPRRGRGEPPRAAARRAQAAAGRRADRGRRAGRRRRRPGRAGGRVRAGGRLRQLRRRPRPRGRRGPGQGRQGRRRPRAARRGARARRRAPGALGGAGGAPSRRTGAEAAGAAGRPWRTTPSASAGASTPSGRGIDLAGALRGRPTGSGPRRSCGGVEADAERIGSATHAALARRELRRLGVRAWTAGGRRGADALTERELEIAAHGGRGGQRTPRSRGRVFLSRKTVERHVSAALAKLGARNRTELAGRARRRSRQAREPGAARTRDLPHDRNVAPRLVASRRRNRSRGGGTCPADGALVSDRLGRGRGTCPIPTCGSSRSDEDASAYERRTTFRARSGSDWRAELQDGPRRNFLDREPLRSCWASQGIATDETRVVLYGDNNNWFAAYAYWCFKLYGHRASAHGRRPEEVGAREPRH